MTDSLSPEERSDLMSRIRSTDTKPERIVRKYLHSLGFRYRLHAADLPGSPDIVFRPQRTAVFVHGCFWHRHEECHLAYTPKSRVGFWESKFEANRARDVRVQEELESEGWKVITVWECQTREGDLGWLSAALRAAFARQFKI